VAITASVSITAGVATVSALAGGTLLKGMTMTYAAQSQPVTPAVSLGTQATGTTGSNGTYAVNNLTTLASSTVTFLDVLPVAAQLATGSLPQITSSTPATATVLQYTVLPPAPLPSGTGGTVIGIPI
jgi:hypothetical protein